MISFTPKFKIASLKELILIISLQEDCPVEYKEAAKNELKDRLEVMSWNLIKIGKNVT